MPNFIVNNKQGFNVLINAFKVQYKLWAKKKLFRCRLFFRCLLAAPIFDTYAFGKPIPYPCLTTCHCFKAFETLYNY